MKKLFIPLLIVLGIGAWLYFGRYYTPEKAFATCQQAVAEKNWPTVMASMTPESQNRAVGALIGATAVASGRHQVAADVLEKHGVDTTELLKDSIGSTILDPAHAIDTLNQKVQEHADRVANKPAFVGDSLTCLESLGTNTDDFFNKITFSKLTNVQTNVNTATGTLTSDGYPDVAIYFRRVEGRWLIDL